MLFSRFWFGREFWAEFVGFGLNFVSPEPLSLGLFRCEFFAPRLAIMN